MKCFVSVVLVLCMVVAVAGVTSAANGTWKSYASDGSGSLTGGTQYAYYQTRINNVQQPEVKIPAIWATLTGDAKANDFSSTTGGVWNIVDPGANVYQKTAVTPGSFDQSRGIVMARIKVNSTSGSVNGSFGFSTSTGYGMQLGLRGSDWRIRTGEGGTMAPDPAPIDQISDYRVYAISWIGNVASVWYSKGNNWSADSAQWQPVLTGYSLPAGSATLNGATNVHGIVLFTANSGANWNGNIEWIAHNTYDNLAGEMNPWDFNPAVPEPSSMVALASGLLGMAGFAVRRRKA